MANQTITVDFNANLARFSSSIDKATADLNRFQSNASRIGGQIKSTFAGLGAGLAVGAFAGFVKEAIDAADEIGKMSQRVGVSAEALSALNYAASLADVSTESLGSGLKKLAVNAADTAKGTGEARDAFAALGISVKDSTGNLKGADVLLGEVATQFAGFEDGAAKTALAVKLFGKAGADLIPLLNTGATGLADMRAEAERLGVIISPEQAKAAEEFNDNLTRVQTAIKGIGVQVSGPFLAAMNEAAAAFQAASDELGTADGLLVGLGRLGTAGQTVAVVWANLAYVFEQVGNELGGIAAQAAAFFSGDFAQAGRIGDMMKEDAKAARAELDDLEKRIMTLPDRVAATTAGKPGAVQAALEGGGKGQAPMLFDTAAAEKNQAALAKAFNTKPIDDFLAKFQDRSRAIDAEYRKLVASLTGSATEGAKGFDIGGEISKARSALAGGDAVGVETSVDRAKEMLKGLKDNGGIDDEITYYARQLQQFEQDALAAQKNVAMAAASQIDQVILDANATAEKLRLPVDTDYLAEQMRQAMADAMQSLRNDPLKVPVVAAPSVGVTSVGARSVAIQTTAQKVGGRL